MRQYKFDKPLVESKLPPKRTDVYWVDVDEQTGCIATIMEFMHEAWYIKYIIDDYQIFGRAVEHLNLGAMANSTDNSIIEKWGDADKYELDAKTAAATAKLSTVISELSTLMTAVNGALPVIESAASAIEDATTAAAVTAAYETLSGAIAGLNADEHVIDNLEALDEAIDYEIE